MKKIKKIFCDVDGTLLHNKNIINDLYYSAKHKIPAKNLNQILDLNDIEFNIASGRTDSNLQKFAQKLNNRVEYIISLNGSIVTHKKKIIYENKLNLEDAKKIAMYLDKHNLFYFMFTSKGIYTGNKKIKNPLGKLIRKWVGVPINKNDQSSEEILNTNDITVYKFSINFSLSWKNLEKKLDNLKNIFPKFYITKSSDFSIDINSKNVSKGELIKLICERSNTNLDEIAVIGDSGNDMSMFELTPHSFCINHADKHLKNYCNHIVKNVAQAISIINDINSKK